MTHLPHSHGGRSEDLFGHMPAPGEFDASAALFRLMSDNTRIRLFWLLCHCEECLLDLSAMMEMSSPALSHHLKLLRAWIQLPHRLFLRSPWIQLLHLPCLCSLIQILPCRLQHFYGQLPSCLC